MAYSDFTLRDIEQVLHLSLVENPDLFSDVSEAVPGPLLQNLLSIHFPLATAINTEKARSELLISPILVEVREQMHHQISLFSGVDLNADAGMGLNGICDFVLSRSAQQQFIHAPIVTIVEAKNENLKSGFGQCIAAMVGAELFNEREGSAAGSIYGVVTTGTLWRFLELAGTTVTLDQQEYHIKQTGKILGILLSVVRGMKGEG